MIRWSFPGNQNGQVKGVADAGIENFNGTELASLARENCQNSLDAAIDEDNPNVIVEFERYRVNARDIPGIDEYRDIISSCKSFWDKSKSEKAKAFLKAAAAHIGADAGFVLRISDFNTTGLSGPYSNVGVEDPFEFDFDGWNALVIISMRKNLCRR